MNAPQETQDGTLSGTTVAAIVESGAQWLTSAGVSFGHGTHNAHDEAT